MFGQTECKPIDDCDNLRLLFLRELPDSACAAVGAGSCSNADPLYQVTYNVFLYYETDSSVSDAELNFMLDYRELYARVSLEDYYSPGFTYIDKSATRACMRNGAGQDWDLDSTVIFDLSVAGELALHFANESDTACGPYNARIQFSPIAPEGAAPCDLTSNCAYAELFPIVVRGYPGDTIRLACENLRYYSYDRTTECEPTGCANGEGTGIPNLNGVSPYIFPQASAPGTPNSQLEVVFGDTLYKADGSYDTQVLLRRNGGSGNLEVSYVEFTVEVNSDVAVPTPTFPVGNTPAKVTKTAGTGSEVTYNLLYTITYNPGKTFAPNTMDTIGVIRVGPPMPFNQIYEVVVKLINEPDSRLRTAQGCSSVNLTADTVLYVNISGEPPCTNLELEHKIFRVEGREDTSGTCPAPYIRFGLVSTGMPNAVEFDYFECLLLIQATGPLNVSDVVFPSNWSCENQLAGCDTTCWDLEPGPGTVVHVRMCRDSSIIQFPADSAFMEIRFTGFGCIDGVDIQLLRFNRDEDSSITCVPIINLENQGFPVCSPEIKGIITSGITNEPIVDVNVTFHPDHDTVCTSMVCPFDTMVTNNFGVFAKCGCAVCESIVITPEAPVGSDYLNGVSTFDLVLINRHILGIEPFDSPYKMIAADANNSKSVTTFDIAELRKLILGVYSELPNCSSWEFVPTGYDFSMLSNPLNPHPPNSIIVTSTTDYDFFGVKIGDVNGSADSSALRIGRQDSTYIEFRSLKSEKNGIIVVPVIYAGENELEALQCGIRFDPKKLEFVGATLGEVEGISSESFGLTQVEKGVIKMLWYAGYESPDPWLQPGTTIFYLTFKPKRGIERKGKQLSFDNAVLDNIAWTPDGKALRLVASEAASRERDAVVTSSQTLSVEASPNPTAGAVRLEIRSEIPTQARVAVFSAFGQMLWLQPLDLSNGETSLETSVLANQPAGVYLWKVWTSTGAKAEGHLVKQ